jgi:hypothetical protein
METAAIKVTEISEDINSVASQSKIAIEILDNVSQSTKQLNLETGKLKSCIKEFLAKIEVTQMNNS